MNQYRCEHREMICHKNKPCGFQEYGDEESEVVFCSFRSIENEDKKLPSGAIFDNTKRMVDEIRQSERDKVLDELVKWSYDYGLQWAMLGSHPILELQKKIEELRQAGEP
jgi:glycerophosphoryl diester phosphodiesterase